MHDSVTFRKLSLILETDTFQAHYQSANPTHLIDF